MLEPTPELHCRERGGIGLCVGCFVASTELKLFLIRATSELDGSGGAHVMGPWAEGYLRAILKDPARFRDV